MKRLRIAVLFISAACAASSVLQGQAIVAGFNSTSDGRNDDGTYTAPSGCTNPSGGGTCAGTLVPLGFTANFFGRQFTQLYINTNGNVTFDSPLPTFTPFDLTTTQRQIIAPFFADVDTRNPASGVTAFGNGTFNGRPALGVTWNRVGYFAANADKLNSFQLLLVDRSDTGSGNFDIVFNYGSIQWETGDESGGTSGLGGSSARAGFSNGTGSAGTFLELQGSAVNGAFLDSNPTTGLIHNSLNSTIPGQYIYFARNGAISAGTLAISGPCPVPAGTAGSPYAGFTVTTMGGTPPYTYTYSLPAGLTFNSTTGVVSGTAPTSSGSYPLSIQVSDSSARTARLTATYSCPLQVSQTSRAPLTLTGTCPGAPYPPGSAIAVNITASGGSGSPYTATYSGPAWLALSAAPPGSNITVAGTAPLNISGIFPFTVTVTDGVSTKVFSCSITILAPPQLQIVSACPASPAPIGTAILQYLTTTGAGNVTWAVTVGSLPAGLTLSGARIFGTPTGPVGTSQFSIAAYNDTQEVEVSCTLTITAAPLRLTSGCPGNGMVSTAYGPYTVVATGTGYSIVATGLPDGVNLSGATIAGTPTKAGNFTIGIQATRGTESVSQSCPVTIAPQPLTLAASCPADTQAGGSVTGALVAAGGQKPYKYSITGPAWLTVDPNTGAVTGTAPQDAGGTSVSFGGSVTDGSTPPLSATVAQGCSFKVLAAATQAPTLTGVCPATNQTQGAAYSLALSVSNGQGPFSWTYDNGYPGLALAATSGTSNTLSGTLGQLGQFTLNVSVADALSRTASKSCSVNVTAPLTITASAPCATTPFEFNSSFTASYTAAGGSGPYSWTVTPAALFTLSAATGSTVSVTGKLTQTGAIPFAVTVTDSVGNTQTYSCPLNVQFTAPSATPMLGTVPVDLTQPVPLTLVLSAPLTVAVTGTVTVTFTSKATHPSPNPPGPATLSMPNPFTFTIPAGATTITLPAIQRGKEAGVVHITITGLSAAGQSVPLPAPIDITIPAQAPVFTADNVQFNDSSAGFDVLIAGSSSTRDITGGSITFNAATGATVQGSPIDLNSLSPAISKTFDTFYTNTSNPSTDFTNLKIPVTIQGDKTAIASVTVTLTNSAGSTTVTKNR